jgi:osmoprotectant transport system permease protein
LDAATGIGMTPGQRLRLVEMPLAMPVIVAGIRTAAVVGVGIATLSAFIGAGGLGTFINRGLALSNNNLILLGAIPAAILALIVDGAIAASQWGLTRARQSGAASRTGLRRAAIAAPLIVVLAGGLAFLPEPAIEPPPAATSSDANASPAPEDTRPPVVIGTKNFTEQLILGELMAQLIESRSIPVKREFNLGGTMICHGALETGSIDLYAEYTGTGLTAILKEDVIADPTKALTAVRDGYRDAFEAEWLSPFGFNNTYAITVTAGVAEELNLETISELVTAAGEMKAGFTAEFAERPDGYPGLRAAYGLRFDSVIDLDPSLMYEAIANGDVHVICAFATDGRIAAFDLQPLIDDRGFFPPYQAAPVIRAEMLATRPELRALLSLLGDRLDDATMQQLNYAVDGDKRAPAAVAREFLAAEGLLDPS